MSRDFKTVDLTIGGQNFQIDCAPENEKKLINAAIHLNTAIDQIQSSADRRAISLEKAAVYVALNLACEILDEQLEREKSMVNNKKKFSRMIREIENVLSA